MAVPSSAIAGAAVSAVALAAIVNDLAAGMTIPSATMTAAMTATRRVRTIQAPRLIDTAGAAAIGVDLVTAVQAVARAGAAADASAALYAAALRAQTAWPVSASPVLTQQYALARALAASVEAACLGEAFVAEARTDFADRQSATQARDRINAAIDGASDRIAAVLGQDVLGILSAAARECATQLVKLSANLQPIVQVGVPVSVPSTVLAWELYGDPSRAPDLVARNRVSTPLFMPTSIEAAAPSTA